MNRDLTARSAFFWYVLPGGGALCLIFTAGMLAISLVPDITNSTAVGGSLAIAFTFAGIVLSLVIGGLVAFLVGGGLEWLLSRVVAQHHTRWLRGSILAVIIAAYAMVTIPPFHDFYVMTKESSEEMNVVFAPRIKIDSGMVAGSRVDSIPGIAYDWSRVRLHSVGRMAGAVLERTMDFSWDGRECVFSLRGLANGYAVSVKGGEGFIQRDMSEYRFPIGSSFVVVPSDSSSWLFVLSQIRVTSLRSVLDVFDRDGRLVFEELVPAYDLIERVEVEGAGSFVVLGHKVAKGSGQEVIQPHPIAYRIVPASERPRTAGIQASENLQP